MIAVLVKCMSLGRLFVQNGNSQCTFKCKSISSAYSVLLRPVQPICGLCTLALDCTSCSILSYEYVNDLYKHYRTPARFFDALQDTSGHRCCVHYNKCIKTKKLRL